MVQRALHPNCQRGIERMCRDPDYDDDLSEDKLEHNEWDYLKKVCDFLADFSEVTLASEGRGASLELVLPQMDFLLTQTEKARDMYKEDPMMRVGVMAAWKKFDKYYALTGRSAAYCAATLFNPAQKKGWIESKWTPKEVEDGKMHRPPHRRLSPVRRQRRETTPRTRLFMHDPAIHHYRLDHVLLCHCLFAPRL